MNILSKTLIIALVSYAMINLHAQQASEMNTILDREAVPESMPQWGLLRRQTCDLVGSSDLRDKCHDLVKSTKKDATSRDYQRLLTCVRLMEVKGDDTLREALEACLLADHLPLDIRRRAALALYRSGNAGRYFVRKLTSESDDDLRSISLWALAIGSNGTNIVTTLEQVRADSGDLTGTYTAETINDVQNYLDVRNRYPAEAASNAQLDYIVQNVSGLFGLPTPPTGPRLGKSVTAEYLWKQLSSLYIKNPEGVKAYLMQEGRDAGTQTLLNTLIDSLTALGSGIKREKGSSESD